MFEVLGVVELMKEKGGRGFARKERVIEVVVA